ncbi:MAG: endolytic transglycosylase MltG [Microgenomates group bacterium]
MKKLYFLIIFILIITVTSYLYYKEGTLPVNKNDQSTKIFVITRGESLNTIAKKLANEGLIRNKIVFYLAVKKLGLERKIQAGDFRLSPSMDVYQIAKTLTHGTLDIWVTFIEGMRKEEMAQIVSNQFNIPEIEFIKLAKEGYLFPDTYLIPKAATAGSIINILENNFHKKFDKSLQEKAIRQNLTPDEAIIIASLVEREAKFDEDRPLVASVILNRLKLGMKLDIDATVQYALGYQPEEKSWWKKNLTKDDLEIDSPYNTYKNQGLPPTPIANPGLKSIKAVINAPKTDYLYYLSDKKGKIHFAKTLEEHNKNMEKYLR